MLRQCGAHRGQDAEELPSICCTIIGLRWRWRFGWILVRWGDRRNPSVSFGSIEKNRSHLFCFLRDPLGRVDMLRLLIRQM